MVIRKDADQECVGVRWWHSQNWDFSPRDMVILLNQVPVGEDEGFFIVKTIINSVYSVNIL